MSAALRLALFSLLLVIHSARPMSVAKRQGGGQVTLCGQHTPCGWGVYDANTRQMDYFVRNICQCDRPRERCLRSADDVSISAYVYRCVRSVARASSSVSSASVGSSAGRSSIDMAPNLIDMKL